MFCPGGMELPQRAISFSLPDALPVNLVIYNALGQEVRRLYAGQTVAAGDHRLVWDGTDDAGRRVASGAYVYELNAGEHTASRRMVMLK